jgi:hypothetical protein
MNFIQDAIDAGFTREQAEFLETRLALYPHAHEIDEVHGLVEALEELEEGEEEEEEGEEE